MKDYRESLSELLGRSEKSVLSPVASELYRGKTVLITGGGGTIGSELARILATLEPLKIIIFDIGIVDRKYLFKARYIANRSNLYH